MHCSLVIAVKVASLVIYSARHLICMHNLERFLNTLHSQCARLFLCGCSIPEFISLCCCKKPHCLSSGQHRAHNGAERLVHRLAYAGQVDLKWAREFLLKPHEGPRVQLAVAAGTPSTGTPFVGLLDAEEAQNRLTQLKEEAIIHPYRLAITVGRVHNSNGQLVEHTASAMPGFSGAPGEGGPGKSLASCRVFHPVVACR